MKKYFIRWRIIAIVGLLLGNIFVWPIVWRLQSGTLTVAFLDVGQGDAIFIQAPNGNQLLIDGGPGRKVLSGLGQVMPFYDRSIDLLIATHPDSDHIGGLPAVLENYEVVGFMEPQVFCDTAVCQTLETAIKDELATRIIAKRGEKINLGNGVELEILSPVGAVAGKDTNTSSVVVKLTYGSTGFLFTGDAPQAVERNLIFQDGENLDVDVLKVGHHGSKTSTAPEFLSATSPRYSIISVGADNRYGHPNQEVLEHLIVAKTKILRTDEWGRIEIKSNGAELKLKATR